MCKFSYSLCQACSYVAALLFFIKHHVHDDERPVKKAKTLLPMKWNQPSKGNSSSMCLWGDVVKLSHGDVPRAECFQQAHRSALEPRQSEHCTLNKESLYKLLAHFEKSAPTAGLENF